MSTVLVSIGGTAYAIGGVGPGKIIGKSLSITDTDDDTPNTARCTVIGAQPTVGQEVLIHLGSVANPREFGGKIIRMTHRYVGQKPANYQRDLAIIDFTWGLNTRKVTTKFLTSTVSAIITSLVSTYTTGYTVAVQADAGVLVIDEITFTNDDLTVCLSRLAKRGGFSWRCDYNKVVRAFIVDTVRTAPTALTSTHPSLSDLTYEVDLSQVVTRVWVEGGGSDAAEAVAVGETILPLRTAVWYDLTGGGTVRAGAQKMTYTSVELGGGGSLVGPGASPSSAPGIALALGTGIEAGVHQYAYTFVTAAGESLPSPQAALTHTAAIADPVNIGTPVNDTVGSGPTNGGSYKWKYTFFHIASGAETLPSNASSTLVSNGKQAKLTLSGCDTPPTGWVRKWYRTAAGPGATYKVCGLVPVPGVLNEAPPGVYAIDDAGDAALGAAAPGANNTAMQKTSLGSIALGPSGTTQRKVYRTVAAGSQLKLQQTIANNTATTGTDDTTADASLGANVPTSDTSGLAQPTGQVLAGATTLLVAGTSAFSSSGGWAVIGNGSQMIRYTGITGSSLTGIPATGVGAILSSVSYNSSITTAPLLRGIPSSGAGSVLFPIVKGDPVNLVVQMNDMVKQAALAAYLGTDGIQEDSIADNRLSQVEAEARGLAQLALRGTAEVAVRYRSRDQNTKAGTTISITLGSPTNLTGDFLIQRVTAAAFDVPGISPTYTVECSSRRFAFEDLLRLARAQAA